MLNKRNHADKFYVRSSLQISRCFGRLAGINMTPVSVNKNCAIHVFANLSLLLIALVALGIVLKVYLSSWWVWGGVFFVAFWLVGFIGHRIFPLLTGPIVDKLFPSGETR